MGATHRPLDAVWHPGIGAHLDFDSAPDPFFFTGCKETAAILQSDLHPAATITNISIHHLTLDNAYLDIELRIENPYVFELPVKSVNYQILDHDTPFATGLIHTNILIPAESSLTLPLRTSVSLKNLKTDCPLEMPGSVAQIHMLLCVQVDVPTREPLSLDVEHEMELPIPAIPQVEITQLQWQKLSLQEAIANVELRVTNANAFAMELSKLNFTLALAGWDVAKLQFKNPVAFEPGSSNQLQLIVTFSPIAAGTALSHALHGQATQYRLYGQFDAQTAFGPMKLPFDRSGQTDLRKAAGVK